MANILLILVFFIFSSSVLASDTSTLKDLPVPTPENLRWNMPADGWRFHEGYVFKGKAFRISEKVNGQKFRGFSNPRSKRVGVVSRNGVLVINWDKYEYIDVKYNKKWEPETEGKKK